MELLVNASQVFAIDVRINLGRRDVDVSQHLLDRSEIRTALEEMRRKGMAESVRRNGLRDSRLPNVFSENLPGAHP